MKTNTFQSIDAYIASFSPDVQEKLQQIRDIVQKAAPKATETIKYAMPTFVYHGNLVYFAAFQNHIGFYAVPSGIEAFKEELSAYKGGKGSVQFPLSQPMPLDLVRRMVEFRVNENEEKAKKPKKAKQSANT